MKEEKEERIWLNHWWGKVILYSLFVGVGVGMYFYIRSTLISSGQEYLMPFINIGIPISLLVGVLIVQFETRLMSVNLIKTVVTFFKRTEYIWFIAIVGAIIAMALAGVYGGEK